LNFSETEYVVPADQRLTIEFVSLTCIVETSSPALPLFPSTVVTEVGDSGNVLYNITAPFSGSSSTNHFYFGNSLVRIYADPGTKVTGFLGTGGSDCQFTLSGYLLPTT
jgi:hypothetical protein